MWSAHFDVSSGPKVTIGNTLEVEAYDKVRVTLDDGTADERVDLQPGGADEVLLLVVKASSYDPPVTYKPVETTEDSVSLDAPLVLIGRAAVGLLGSAPRQFRWSNDTGAEVDIEILVGRDATPA